MRAQSPTCAVTLGSARAESASSKPFLGDFAPGFQGYLPLCYLWEAASLRPSAVPGAALVGPFPMAADSSVELQPCVEAASKFP